MKYFSLVFIGLFCVLVDVRGITVIKSISNKVDALQENLDLLSRAGSKLDATTISKVNSMLDQYEANAISVARSSDSVELQKIKDKISTCRKHLKTMSVKC
ncbi:hypothetical protein FQA39_LY15578 [Lamprigera yunnana]|nr:hypothetical protein FQA39_LY15578 [Lamprigera yunnana]